MNFSEILRYELWSKRTTRKMFIGIGILIVTAWTGLWCWTQFQLRWLTSGERNAARVALHEVDLLDSREALSTQEFSSRLGRARAAVDAAQAAARTYRDGIVEMDLHGYLFKAVMNQKRLQKGLKVDPQSMSAVTDLVGDVRTRLHKILD